MGKKIIYQKDSHFNIIPNLLLVDLLNFKKLIYLVKSSYENDNHFFWEFDQNKNMIIINDLTDAVENDIYNQLEILVYWLFQRNYLVKGSFICYKDDLTEFINIDGIRSILHYTTMNNDLPLTQLSESLQLLQSSSNIPCNCDKNNKIIEYLYFKINNVENKMHQLKKQNQFLYKLINFISIITIGSLFLVSIVPMKNDYK